MPTKPRQKTDRSHKQKISKLQRQIHTREKRGWAYARDRVRCLPDPPGDELPKTADPAGDGRTCIIDGECVPMPGWVRDAIDPTGPEWRTIRPCADGELRYVDESNQG